MLLHLYKRLIESQIQDLKFQDYLLQNMEYLQREMLQYLLHELQLLLQFRLRVDYLNYLLYVLY